VSHVKGFEISDPQILGRSCCTTTYLHTLFHGSTAPCGLGPSHCQGLRLHSDTPQSVGLLWTSYQPVAKNSTWQKATLTTEFHSSSGIRTRNPASSGRGLTP